jgi:hypothetical protein
MINKLLKINPYIIHGCFALAVLLPAAAENLLPEGDFEDPGSVKFWNPPGIQIDTAKHSGSFSMKTPKQARNFIFSTELIEVDPAATYRLSGFFRVPPEAPEMEILFGLRCYDGGQELTPESVKVVPNTETTLAVDAKEGDETVKVRGDSWTPGPLLAIAFNTREDLSDLPNLSAAAIREIIPSSDVTEVKLRQPLAKGYPADTPVRLHKYTDYINHNFHAGQEWEEQSLTISGESEAGMPSNKQFWHGTKFVRITIFVGVDKEVADQSLELLVDDLTFTKE